MMGADLVAIRAERRRIAVAVFSGLTLDCTCVRELSTDGTAAQRSARAFVGWAVETFRPRLVAVEKSSATEGTRRAFLDETVARALFLTLTTRLWVPPETVRAAWGVPPMRTRSEVRRTVGAIFPDLTRRRAAPAVLDAAALGLHLQMLSLLSDE